MLFGFSFNVVSENASKSIKMSALEFPGIIQMNKRGAFDLFVSDLMRLADISLEYLIMSPARGAKEFFNANTECLIPGSLYPSYYAGIDVIHSVSFAKVNYLAFTLKENEKITDRAQLHGKVIGIIRSEGTWDYIERFGLQAHKVVQVSNVNSLLEMLYKKRIDVAIHDHGDFVNLAKYLDKPLPNFSLENPIAVDDLVISCHNTEVGKKFIKDINPEIKQILEQGMEQYYKRSSIQ